MPTLATYRHTVSPLLGIYESGTADSSGNSTSLLVCSTSLLASGTSAKSTVLSSSTYKGKWMYLPSGATADKSRLIDTYTPSTGGFKPDNNWSAAPTSLAFEILSPFSGTELNELINLALKKLFVTVDFTFVGAGTSIFRNSLATAASWLTDPSWIYQVGSLVTATADLTTMDPYRNYRTGRADIDTDGSTVYLRGPTFATTETAYVKAIKPAYDHCAAAATPTVFTQAGLSADADVAKPHELWVAYQTMLEAADRLDHLLSIGQADQKMAANRQLIASRLSRMSRGKFIPPERTFTSPAHMGPTSIDTWSRASVSSW